MQNRTGYCDTVVPLASPLPRQKHHSGALRSNGLSMFIAQKVCILNQNLKSMTGPEMQTTLKYLIHKSNPPQDLSAIKAILKGRVVLDSFVGVGNPLPTLAKHQLLKQI